MTKYRKKPVVIDAFYLSPEPTDAEVEELHAFLGETGWESDRDGAVLIHTPEGTMRGDPGDWIIRGVENELYPCKPSVFDATYEPVDDS